MSVAIVAAGIALFWIKPWVQNEEPASVERMAFPLPDKPSIAVLPFTNMSGDVEQEYFVDGMTEDLITDLSKLSGLFVIARNSVFTYKDKAVKVGQVAEELGVRYVLEGSVRRAGDQVRINVQLIDATTGGHLWAERYDGSLADVFTLQDSVTKQIVAALSLSLTDDQGTKDKATSAQAYDAFLKGWAHYQRHTGGDLNQAIPYLEQAIQLDAEYAQAHAALAAVYWELRSNNWAEHLSMSPRDVMTKAKLHVRHSMEEATPLAHWVASNIAISEGNYQSAVSEAKQIVAIDSNNAAGYAQLASALELSGKTEESAEVIQRAVRLDPYSSPLHAAVQKGDVDTVRQLINEQVHIDARNHYGKTSLHVAAEAGQAEIAALLIEGGAGIETRTNSVFSKTSLMLAARSGHTSVAELLISAGADVNAIESNGWAVLLFAIESGQTDIAELLIANGADIDLRSTDQTRRTPLLGAARKGNRDMVELLIKKGANVNAPDGNGNTPLHAAAISGDINIVQLLLANGADIKARTEGGGYPGETPLRHRLRRPNTDRRAAIGRRCRYQCDRRIRLYALTPCRGSGPSSDGEAAHQNGC
ncbi:MAG: ankyrin repeat domain-containing protein [Arenicellales bacterium]